MSENQINILIQNGELIYNKETNEWLMNHLSRTCNVDANIRYVHRTLDRILQLHVASHCIFGTACSGYSTT